MKKNRDEFLIKQRKGLRLCKFLKLCLLIGILFLPNMEAIAGAQKERLNVDYKKESLNRILKDLQKKTDKAYFYSQDDIIKFKDISFKIDNGTLKQILEKALVGTGLQYDISTGSVVIKKAKPINQQDKKEIKGKVTDNKNVPLPGVAVVIQGTTIGTATDSRGRYTILASSKDALTFSFVGMKTKIKLIGEKTKIDITLLPEVESLEEVTVVAFGEQKKESVVSSITSVKADDLKTSSSDLTSALAGKIAGLIGWQTGGMPAALKEDEMNTKFYIRGITSYQTDANIDPLILLDGVEVSKLDLSRVNPDDIESFNVLKDASATAMYGARGANGVIYVKTKKGKAGAVYTTFRYEKIWSSPTRELDVVGPKEYMTLYNEAFIGRHPGAAPKYTRERIENTNNPNFPSWVNPGIDWYDKLFHDKAINNHYALNVRGGGEKIQYYVSATYNEDNGMIKTDKLSQFDCNITNKQTSFRANLNVKLTSTAKLILNSFTTYDDYHGTIENMSAAYFLAFAASPVDFAVTYPKDQAHAWPHVRFGGSESSYNPYARIHAGYKDRTRYSSVNKFEYIQNLNSFIKGLELRASIALNKNGYYTNAYSYVPAKYKLKSYDPKSGEHILVPLNKDKATHMVTKNHNVSGDESASQTISDVQVKLLHTAAWNDHTTSLTGVFTARESDNSLPAQLLNSLPQRNLGFAARASYGYKNRYFIEGSFGVNGSERFAKGNKMGFFPAVGCAWVASDEDFMRSVDGWLSYLKFRFSYGQTGNDGVIRDPRFVYLQEIEQGEYQYSGYPNKSKPFYNIKNYKNLETKWEVSEMMNFGTELKLFKGLIDLNVDLYQEIRHNIYDYRVTLPASMGLYQAPLDNVGTVKSRGMDIAGKIQHAFSSDFWFILNGTFTYNKAVFEEIEEPFGKKSWQKRKGHDISQQFAYIADGIFQDQAEIDNSPLQTGDVQPGDIRYRDIDGNGKIDINDAVMAGHPETPRIIYGTSAFVHYKGFEAGITFQGTGDRSFFINPQQISPFDGNRAVLKAIADDHWTAENHKVRPFWPKLSTKNIITHNVQENYYPDGKNSLNVKKSTYFMRNGKFLRCKQIELGAYLNEDWIKRFKLRTCRFYCKVSNPFIISDFKVWDVELGENGFNYPIQKTYSLGLTVSF